MKKVTITRIEHSFMSIPDRTTYPPSETIARIIKLTEELTVFWNNVSGWAPIEAAELLTKSRLDWQVSLAKQLTLFQEESNESGKLILGWTTLGSLTEGAMKLYLSVYYETYQSKSLLDEFKPVIDKKGNVISPDELMLDKLRLFFSKKVLPVDAKEQWEKSDEINWLNWILKIQQRRNAIHAFKSRDLGDFREFHLELSNYLIFLRKINNGLPYPDDQFKPKEV